MTPRSGWASVFAFSVIGLLLAVTTLIVVPSVMADFRQELLERFAGMNDPSRIARALEGYTEAYAV